MTEQWRPIVGYEGLYEVSDHGRVRSVDRFAPYPGGKPRRRPGRIRSQYLHHTGRPEIRLYRDGSERIYRVHTLVLEAFIGLRPDGLICCHNDGDATNNHLSNLRWDTPRSNNLDTVRHGTHVSASKTRCVNGHEFSPENTGTDYRGNRECRTCRAQRSRQVTDKGVRRTAERRWAERLANPDRTLFAVLPDGSHVVRYYWPGRPAYFREWPPETLRVRVRLHAAEFSALVRGRSAA